MTSKYNRLIQGLHALAKGQRQFTYTCEQKSTIIYHYTIKQLYKQQLDNEYPWINLSELIIDFQDALSLPSEMLGKRSSQIIVSFSRKYCLKLADSQSVSKIQEMLKAILEFKKQQPQSFCLIDIYRVYQIEAVNDKGMKYTDFFILMPSLRRNFNQVINIYDIKGFLEGRKLDEQEYLDFKFGKDQNFIQSKDLSLMLKLQEKTLNQFIKGLQKNFQFLQKFSIIDYSLLIEFRVNAQQKSIKQVKQLKLNENVVVQWAIIDYFQTFNKKKVIQNKFKSLFRKQISSVQSDVYHKRFVQFVSQYFGKGMKQSSN